MEPNPSRQRSPSGRCSGLSNAPGARSARGILAFARVRRRRVARSAAQPLPRGRVIGRHMAVRRVDNDGGSNLSIDHGICRALVQPQTIVAADRAAARLFQNFKKRFPVRWCRRPPAAEGDSDPGALASLARRAASAFWRASACSLVRTRRIAGQPLERRHRGQVVGALQVRMSIRRAGQSGLGRVLVLGSHERAVSDNNASAIPMRRSTLAIDMNRFRISTPPRSFAQRMLSVRAIQQFFDKLHALEIQ